MRTNKHTHTEESHLPSDLNSIQSAVWSDSSLSTKDISSRCKYPIGQAGLSISPQSSCFPLKTDHANKQFSAPQTARKQTATTEAGPPARCVRRYFWADSRGAKIDRLWVSFVSFPTVCLKRDIFENQKDVYVQCEKLAAPAQIVTGKTCQKIDFLLFQAVGCCNPRLWVLKSVLLVRVRPSQKFDLTNTVHPTSFFPWIAFKEVV